MKYLWDIQVDVFRREWIYGTKSWEIWVGNGDLRLAEKKREASNDERTREIRGNPGEKDVIETKEEKAFQEGSQQFQTTERSIKTWTEKCSLISVTKNPLV